VLEPIRLHPGDRVLLASDGLAVLSDNWIAEALAAPNAREAADNMTRRLIDMQQEHQDNVTLVVVSIADR